LPKEGLPDFLCGYRSAVKGWTQLKFGAEKPILSQRKRSGRPRVAWLFIYIVLLMGGLVVVGASGDLVSADRYDLLFGPAELAQSISSLGDMVDYKMALQSALAREYGTTNIAQVIQLLSNRYDAVNPVTIPTPDLNINIPLNNNNPLDGVVAGGQAMRDFYSHLFNEMSRNANACLH
jgi:hypothetical protein